MISDCDNPHVGCYPSGRRRRASCLLILLALGLFLSPVKAAVNATGNVTPSYPVSAPDPWLVGSELTVANFASGAVVISAGSEVQSSGGTIGFDPGTLGIVEVTGAGSTWNSSQSIIAGDFGEGRLQVLQGGLVLSDGGSLGHLGGRGEAIVEGSESRWTSTDLLIIGNSSQGNLTIRQGGRVESTEVQVGLNLGATGRVDVEGLQSSLAIENSLNLGDTVSGGLATVNLTGQGSRIYLGDASEAFAAGLPQAQTALVIAAASAPAKLNVYKGAAIHNAGSAYMAAAPASTADVLIRGADAAWNNGGALAVGGAGHATLRLESGGTASAGAGLSIAPLSEVRGVGVLTAAVVNGGIVTPGNNVGELSVVGSYVQQETGELKIDIGGRSAGQWDKLSILGSASLGGRLTASLVDLGSGAMVPALGDQFALLTATSGTSGFFSSLSLPPMPQGLTWQVRYGATNVTLAVTLPGDFDGDGDVDGADLAQWSASPRLGGRGDADADGDSDGADFLIWQSNFGLATPAQAAPLAAVPEPSSQSFVASIGGLAMIRRRLVRKKLANAQTPLTVA